MTNLSFSDQTELFHGVSDSGLRVTRTRNSVLWAAYADALGFISELVDAKGLKRRTQGEELKGLIPWNRRIGGRGGVNVQLPAGCWSDDTQLRMAVSRSISRHGFDVETFARVELPIWPSYALGGGRASKAAAKNLATPSTMWYANTFRGWCDAGGNGVAMRIQPHVWSSSDLDGSYMLDVITDAVCTHGHPRAIIGACFHASTLAHCLQNGTVPTLDECAEIAAGLSDSLSLIESHNTLGSMWGAFWERQTGKEFREEWHATLDELRESIEQVAIHVNGAECVTDAYRAISERLGLEAEHQRGSGILTPVAAAALAVAAPSPYAGVAAAANALGTDTDTIGTMAGALLGACYVESSPPEHPLDRAYLLNEADRLVAISQGNKVKSHQYPDILTWAAPQTQADALVTNGTHLIVEGLGPVKEMDKEPFWTSRKNFAWQWVETAFGQTLLIKRRPELRPLKASNNLEPPLSPTDTSRSHSTSASHKRKPSPPYTPAPLDRGLNIDNAVSYAKNHIAEDDRLGYTVRRAARDGTISDLVALVTSLRDDLRR